MRATYAVSGLTCDHCVRHVLDEVRAIPGVTAADLTLADGRLVVEALAPLDFTEVQAAAHEAGDYVVAPAP